MSAVSWAAQQKLKENQAKYSASPRGKWSQQKAQAKARGIGFTLTFEEWRAVWEDSGKYDHRGKAPEDYCMGRMGDAGGYDMGTVAIQKVSENLTEQLTSGAHKSVKMTAASMSVLSDLKSAGAS